MRKSLEHRMILINDAWQDSVGRSYLSLLFVCSAIGADPVDLVNNKRVRLTWCERVMAPMLDLGLPVREDIESLCKVADWVRKYSTYNLVTSRDLTEITARITREQMLAGHQTIVRGKLTSFSESDERIEIEIGNGDNLETCVVKEYTELEWIREVLGKGYPPKLVGTHANGRLKFKCIR